MINSLIFNVVNSSLFDARSNAVDSTSATLVAIYLFTLVEFGKCFLTLSRFSSQSFSGLIFTPNDRYFDFR